MPLTPGTRLGPYEIQSALGAGGMGEVYKARDTRLDRIVAIKVLPEHVAADPDLRQRFEREARTLAALSHPHIVQIFGLETAGSTTQDPAYAENVGRVPQRDAEDVGRVLQRGAENVGRVLPFGPAGTPVLALVMEYLEGETLAQRLARGPGLTAQGSGLKAHGMTVEEALQVAIQIADALDKAHRKGIVHRDLKPGNIMLTKTGAKLLDFGLAKLAAVGRVLPSGPAGSREHDPAYNLSKAPTVSSPLTGAGAIVGTFQYMAPEQLEGQEADARTDIFAFGATVYEMVTGKRAFEGKTQASLIGAIMHAEPPAISSLQPVSPPALDRIVTKCLAKDPDSRWQSAGDLHDELRWVADGGHSGAAIPTAAAPVTRQPLWRRALVPVATLILGGAIVGGAVWLVTTPPVSRTVRFAITPSGTAAITAMAADRELAVTPAGTHIVYVGNSGTQLFVRALDQLDLKPLTGLGAPRGPFLSPDGQWIGFFDGASNVATLKKVTLTGGPPVAICSFSNGTRAGGTWGEDGTIVFATTDSASGLWRVSAGGGTPTLLTKPNHERGEADHLWPEFLPGGQAVLFTITPVSGSGDASQVAVLDLRSGQWRVLVQGGSHAHYVSSGHLVYGVAGTLRAVAFDLRRLEVTGTPVPVLSDVAMSRSGDVNFDMAQDGTLVYVIAPSTAVDRQLKRTLVWVDRQGREEPISAPARAYTSPHLSPDGTEVAVAIRDQEDDVWIWSFVSRTLRRFTFGAGLDDRPVWTPDGRRLVFSSDATGGASVLFWQAADGTGAPTRLTQTANGGTEFAWTVSPDGAGVVFSYGNDLMLGSLDGNRRIRPLFQTSFRERFGAVSPDGRWLAYEADDSGRGEIYVRPFPDVNGGRWQISTAGGTQPRWARSGRELFYLAASGALMRANVDGGTTWRPSTPAQVFEGVYFNGFGLNTGETYDVSLDASRFLMIKRDPSEPAGPSDVPTPVPARPAEEGLVVVQHFDEELRRLVPAK